MKFLKGQLKGFLAGIMAALLLGTTALAAGDYALSLFEVKVVFNGQEKKPSDKPFMYNNGQAYVPASLIYNGTTYVPLRFFSEVVGLPVSYVGKEKTIYIGEKKEGAVQTGYLTDIMGPYYIESNYKIFNVNKEMKMAGKTYTKGLQLQNLSFYLSDTKYTNFSYNLEGKYKSLNGILGLDDNSNTSNAVIEFYGDGELIKKYDLAQGSLPQNLELDITGVVKFDVKFTTNYIQDNMWCKINLADLKIE